MPESQDDSDKWHLLQHVLDDTDTHPLEDILQSELIQQLSPDKDKKRSSYSWRVLLEVNEVYKATKVQGDTDLTIPPFFKNAGRENE